MIEPERDVDSADSHFMRHALTLAGRNLGQAWPNPAVGAVVVKDGAVVGAGWTARGGRPHAEPQALAQAGAEARNATLYVTLEPCAHHGQTPPCTEAIIRTDIARVVTACRDPHPSVNGGGIAALRDAGIKVMEGVCTQQAEALNEGFFSVIRRGIPFVAVKVAASRDGRILTGNGRPRWITGEASQAYAHLLRSRYDAILTGIGTALADDPLLTCRLPGLSDRSPVRVLLDSESRLPPHARLRNADAPLWIEKNGHDLKPTLQSLAARGITRLLVEAGPTLTRSFFKENLVDRVYWFRAPHDLSDEGIPAAEAPSWPLKRMVALGEDALEIYDH